MVDMISSILGVSDPAICVPIAGSILIIFYVVVIDLIYRIFHHFWK